jgi:hypothetical protein
VASERFLDVERTEIHRRFFDTFGYVNASECLRDLKHLSIDCDAFSNCSESQYGYSGWLYWLLYMKGYAQYQADGAIHEDNVYLTYLKRHYAMQHADPTMRSVMTSPAAIARIGRRFADCDELSAVATAADFAKRRLAPVTLYIRMAPAEEDRLLVSEIGCSQPIRARLIDGHHRLFAARLFNVRLLRFEVLMEAQSVPDIPGQVEHISLDGNRLKIRGWVAPPSLDVHGVEVRSGDRTVSRGSLVKMRANQAFPLERKFTFTLDSEVTIPAGGLGELEVMILENWLPVGKVSIAAPRIVPSSGIN